jgi:hypothetical protein
MTVVHTLLAQGETVPKRPESVKVPKTDPGLCDRIKGPGPALEWNPNRGVQRTNNGLMCALGTHFHLPAWKGPGPTGISVLPDRDKSALPTGRARCGLGLVGSTYDGPRSQRYRAVEL